MESIAKDAPLSQTQKVLYGVFTVGGQYAWARANRYITSQGWGELDEVIILSIYNYSIHVFYEVKHNILIVS